MKKAVVAAVGVSAYSWWAAGVAPFSWPAYVAVGIPSMAAVTAYSSMGGFSARHPEIRSYYRQRADGASLTTAAPWFVVLVFVGVLEFVGLALGGRAASAPTLSTVVDHLLEARWERFVLFATWLLVGGLPLVRLRQLRARRDS